MLLLMKRIEDMHAEQAYLKELRGEANESSTDEEEPTSTAVEESKSEKAEGKDGGEEAKAKKIRAERREEADSKELQERISSDPHEAAIYYHRLSKLTRQEFKSMKRQHAKASNSEAKELILNSKLDDLAQEKAELEVQVAKSAKGTRLVICLQNYVRKMLQQNLEQMAT